MEREELYTYVIIGLIAGAIVFAILNIYMTFQLNMQIQWLVAAWYRFWVVAD